MYVSMYALYVNTYIRYLYYMSIEREQTEGNSINLCAWFSISCISDLCVPRKSGSNNMVMTKSIPSVQIISF
jgi:hypothetical protein